jgi:hypothetical protein
MKKLIALVLVFAMLLSLGILPASAEPIPVSEEKEPYVFTEADNAILDEDVFARIDAVKTAAADQKDGISSLTEQDYINLVPDVIQAVKASETYVPGTLQQNGFFLVWETTEPVGVMTWADQEPSYTDSRDGAAEDYIMLWNTGSGWAYIDCRNDPIIADGKVDRVNEHNGIHLGERSILPFLDLRKKLIRYVGHKAFTDLKSVDIHYRVGYLLCCHCMLSYIVYHFKDGFFMNIIIKPKHLI